MILSTCVSLVFMLFQRVKEHHFKVVLAGCLCIAQMDIGQGVAFKMLTAASKTQKNVLAATESTIQALNTSSTRSTELHIGMRLPMWGETR